MAEERKQQPTRVAIVVPSGDMMHTDCAMGLIQMVALSTVHGVQVGMINPKSSLVQKGRRDGVEAALGADVDYVLFIDSDIVAPADTLLRLLGHGKEVVGGVYPKRVAPYHIAAHHAGGQRVTLEDCDKALGEGYRMPLGCMLIKAEIYEAFEQPWFHVPWIEEDQQYLGEDYWLCDRLRQMGVQPWIDYDLSRELVHGGMVWINHKMNMDK